MVNYKDEEDLFSKVAGILAREPKLIQLPASGKAIIAGDTHGDIDATRSIIKQYLKGDNKIVFLGDYVDRGPCSRQNVHLLLSTKLAYPDAIILLMGNHEGFTIKKFLPAEFWMDLSKKERAMYGSIFTKLPLAISTRNGVIALHGALPDLSHINKIDEITPGDESWDQLTWGDFDYGSGGYLGKCLGRPRFGYDYFKRVMDTFNKNVLIRSHQPDERLAIYGNRCLTLFTSSAYFPKKRVAVVNLAKKEIKTIDDLTIVEI